MNVDFLQQGFAGQKLAVSGPLATEHLATNWADLVVRVPRDSSPFVADLFMSLHEGIAVGLFATVHALLMCFLTEYTVEYYATVTIGPIRCWLILFHEAKTILAVLCVSFAAPRAREYFAATRTGEVLDGIGTRFLTPTH
ncbi:uncharacterized protein N7446_001437 [Penicillium canescens]|uniref:Uncharacterized protein n=1 Tax=Penicillium canescens TaxID=5083 RepID=A0AAD6N8V5_PENCN|nr:uncharacterized protein N7446_001437 [Penicillium canescens]KAJ6043242.1 hypothetical protein N7460_004597 [Penicillium canescens]KAJ6054717.1 hypothetical protein N7444_003815 [Penicillium canescens]KAJ6073660.1 hypothetical protein N7446_001437 [Penicillium canescens]